MSIFEFQNDIEERSQKHFDAILENLTKDIQKYETNFDNDFLNSCNCLIFQLGFHLGNSFTEYLTKEHYNQLLGIINVYKEYYVSLLIDYNNFGLYDRLKKYV